MDKPIEDQSTAQTESHERDHLFLQVLIRLSVIEETLIDKGILSLEELESLTEKKALELTTKIEYLLKALEDQKG